ISKELLKNPVFTFLLATLSALTSLMFFFVHFSIDGNKKELLHAATLSENQQLYLKALESNTILATNMLIVLTGLTAFVFGMFYYRFLKGNSKQIGCLKALGFKSSAFYCCFSGFTASLSLIGGVVGFGLGYFAADVLLNANMRSYAVTDLVKSVNLSTVLVGVFIPMIAYCLVSVCSYAFICRKEAAVLMTGERKQSFTFFTTIANRFVQVLPVKNKFPLRIALRKPVVILLIFSAVMGFTVMFVMGYSLTLSSSKIYASQTEGHLYKYDTVFEKFQIAEEVNSSVIYYLHTNAKIQKGEKEIGQQVVGLEGNKAVFTMKNSRGKVLPSPAEGRIYISPALEEVYGIKIGDTVKLFINDVAYTVTVADVAVNSKTNTVYMEKNELAKIMRLPKSSYTGALSLEKFFDNGTSTTNDQKLKALERDAVSGKNSALINQLIGCFSGCILIFLALLISFQDNTKDMLIMHSMGYRSKPIRKLFIDIYLPIVWCAFAIMLIPSIYTAYSIQRSLSLQMEDYLPFQINFLAILLTFALLNVVYFIVQSMFGFGIKRILKKENILNAASVE
ncbi:MAG: FtsX-like permease family protein, partial [Anaerovoracaceae bacterium]